MIKYLDYINYWAIVLIPFAVAIAPAPASVLVGLLLASFLAKKIIRKEPLFSQSSLNKPMFFLFMITIVSAIHSICLMDTLKGGIGRLLMYMLVFFSLKDGIKDKRHIWCILISVCFGLVLTCLNEIWQVYSGKDFIRGYDTIINIGLVRATSSFKDANTLGVYLSALVPLIIGVALFCLKRKHRLLFIAMGILSLIGVLLTYSRPTLLAVYVALLFLGIARKNKLLVAFMIIFMLIAPFLLPRSFKEWARQMHYNPIRVMCNDDRIAIYFNSMNMIKAHPVIGVGANTFMKNYKEYKDSPEWGGIVTSDYLYAHNNFLQLSAEIGLIGLMIFIWLLFRLFSECAKIYRHLTDNFLRMISLSLVACLIAFLVNGLTESSLYSSRVAVLFWYLMGFAVGLAKFGDAHTHRSG